MAYNDIELDLIDNEPPGLFPQDQASLWGTMRHVFAQYMQDNFVAIFSQWYLNADPRLVNASDIAEWERMLGLLVNSTRDLAVRRASVLANMQYGVFTRARRQQVIESYIIPTFGAAPALTPSGLPIGASGIPLHSGAFSLAGTYTITENVTDFSYIVRLAVGVDTASLYRDLRRVTPAHINFTLVAVGGLTVKSGGAALRNVGGGTRNVLIPVGRVIKSGGAAVGMRGGGTPNSAVVGAGARQVVVTYADFTTP